MADVSEFDIFTDSTWTFWEPLIKAVGPHGKMPPKHLRRTISAIFWRHQNRAKWRSIPAELGPWWLAAQLFIRWAKQDVWERLLRLEVVQQRSIALGMPFFDVANLRAPQPAAETERRKSTARSEICARRLAALATAMASRSG